MAKKRRKDEIKKEEEYEFIPPEFNEKSFLQKDIEGTKALMLTAIFAVIFGILAFVGSLAKGALGGLLGLVAFIAGAIVLRYSYPILKIKKEDVDRKTQLGNYALYALLFLGIWILLMNPPFSG